VLSVAQNALVTHDPPVAQRSRWHTGAARAVLHAYPGSDTQPTSLVHGISEAHAALDASLASPSALPSLAELLSPTTPASLALTSTPWPVLHAASESIVVSRGAAMVFQTMTAGEKEPLKNLTGPNVRSGIKAGAKTVHKGGA
jgi:hypothetical protein